MEALLQSTGVPHALEISSDSIFYPIPDEITVDEDSRTEYASLLNIETLIKELHEKGPLVALAQIGPSAYKEPPFQLANKMCGQNIHGWRPGTHEDYTPLEHALILGARKFEEREYVYFTMSVDFIMNSSSFIRKHRPSSTDSKVYIISHKTFRDHLVDFYPPAMPSSSSSSASASASGASSQSQISAAFLEKQYVAELVSLPLHSILERGVGEKDCKALGQEIFDEFKDRAGGDSSAGREAVDRICERLTKMRRLRKRYVERAWDGIGDSTWRWIGIKGENPRK